MIDGVPLTLESYFDSQLKGLGKIGNKKSYFNFYIKKRKLSYQNMTVMIEVKEP